MIAFLVSVGFYSESLSDLVHYVSSSLFLDVAIEVRSFAMCSTDCKSIEGIGKQVLNLSTSLHLVLYFPWFKL